jgi:hypothetical protein
MTIRQYLLYNALDDPTTIQYIRIDKDYDDIAHIVVDDN